MKDEKYRTSLSRCLVEDISKAPTSSAYSLQLDESKLPLPLVKLPASVTTLEECALHQIQCLLEKEAAGSLSAEEEDCLDDGFFLCDLNVVQHKLQVWRSLFPRVHPFFAVKCNPDPMVACVIGQLGGGFDCASVPEIELALKSSSVSSAPETMIVYANPQRAEQHLDRSLELNIQALTFDGPEELHKISRAYQKKFSQSSVAPSPPSMILRILVPDEHSSVPLGEKFGAPPDRVASLTTLAMSLDLPIVGVSFHCGSGNHDPASYQKAIELAVAAMETIDQVQKMASSGSDEEGNHAEPCWLLDIGGGYPGVDGMGGDLGRFCGDHNRTYQLQEQDPTDQETTAKIAQVVAPYLDRLFGDTMLEASGTSYPEKGSMCASNDINDDNGHQRKHQPVLCIAEPGRYFVEAAFALCSRIYRVQIEEGDDQQPPRHHYYLAQGVQGVFKDCILCNESFVPIPLSLSHHQETQEQEHRGPAMVLSTVHGPSGEDYDVICRDYPLPVLEVGDWLVFDRMGAYTLSIAARHGRPPVRYVLGATRLETYSNDEHPT